VNKEKKENKLSNLPKLFLCTIGIMLYWGAMAQNDSLEIVQYFYDDGVVSSEGQMIDGVPTGIWKSYYPSGQLKTLGGRENNLLQDEWYFYRENGELERIITYSGGKKNGYEEIYTLEGILKEKYFFVDDSKEDVSYTYYADGKVAKEIPYENNKRNGKGLEYGTDGRRITLFTYKDDYVRSIEKINRYNLSGLKTGKWIIYKNNSERIIEEGNYSNGKKNGLFKIYNKRGDLDRIETYKNGKLIEDNSSEILDVQKELSDDGSIKSIGSYANGKKQGIFREYDSEGNIISSSVYKNDVKVGEGVITGSGAYEGSWKIYYPTGELRAEGEYNGGVKEGSWKYYFISGELEQKGKFKKGKASGEWIWFFKSGETKREEYYRKGKEDGESVEYDKNGGVINRGNYVDGYKTGEWFLTVGDYTEEGEFIDDEKNGKWVSYYKKTGNQYFEGEYSLGIPIKKHIYYYANGIKKEEGKHEGGERHGDWKFYNRDGSIKLIIRYTNGLETRINGEKV